MMSPSAAYTFEAVMAHTLLFGACTTCRVLACHEIVLSATDSPTVVGHVGSTVPDFRIGTARYVMRVAISASQITVPSVTCRPLTVGHTGSVASDVPMPGCTALNTSPSGGFGVV